ncbi:MAG: ATP-binding cassette domain-containing protein [Steroidobacteraceae bacterium]
MQIELKDLRLTRDERVVLENINWTLCAGERWWVIGPNGAGKTQLLKLLAGDVWPDPAPQPVRRYRHRGAWHDTPRELKDDIAYLGPERQDKYERYGWNFPAWVVVATGMHRTDIPLSGFTPAQQRRSREWLARAGAGALADRHFLTLSYGERRLTLLARALASRPSVLLLDEVATGLDEVNRRRLLRLIARGAGSRMSWVATAHRAEDLPPGASHLLLLEQGGIRYAGPLTAARRRQLLAAPPQRAPRPAPAQAARSSGGVLVELCNATIYIDEARVLRDVDFTLRRGECWVVHGANGSGKSTLLRTIYGDHGAASGGSIRRAGVVPGVPLEHFRARTGFIAPQLQTDMPRHLPVLDVVVSGLHSSIGLNEPVSASERRRALPVLRRYGLAGMQQRNLAQLSYGQVRRVLFARAAIARPRLLLLDEPYAGLDRDTRHSLHQALEREIGDGLTVVIATHYRAEWPAAATGELQLAAGRIRYQGPVRR